MLVHGHAVGAKVLLDAAVHREFGGGASKHHRCTTGFPHILIQRYTADTVWKR